MQRDALVAELDAELRIQAFADGQENGLQVEGKDTIKRVVGAVSVSAQSIEAAVAAGADALVTHHGLLWHNQPLHVRGIRRRRLQALLDAELNLLTYHLPLDAHPRLGNNAALADAAGCAQTEPAFELKGNPIGVTGKLAKPAPFAPWVEGFEAALRADCGVETGPFAVWDFGPKEIQRIGFLSGAGPIQVQEAIDRELDVYVTGETTEGAYHLAREAGIHFVAAGHYLSERGGIKRLLGWMEQLGVTGGFVDVETRA
jgi:dinuclear metal center YbgI/SA1388 family protein